MGQVGPWEWGGDKLSLGKGTSLVWRPPQGEFLRAFPFGLLKYNPDASEPLWLAKDQPNRLAARLSRTPAFFISLQ